jgi:hypothetical protein
LEAHRLSDREEPLDPAAALVGLPAQPPPGLIGMHLLGLLNRATLLLPGSFNTADMGMITASTAPVEIGAPNISLITSCA